MAKSKTETRLYRVDELNDDGTVKRPHIVRATHPAVASAYVARNLIRSKVATQEDLRELRTLEEEFAGAVASKEAGITMTLSVAPGAVESIASGKGADIQCEGKTALRILPADEPEMECAPEPSHRVAETDAIGKPVHLVVGA